MKVSRGFIATLLLPAILLYLVFFLVPAARTIYYSLFDWSGVGQDMTFLGLGNYQELLGDALFRLSMRNTLIILLLGGAAIFGLSFMFTAMLNSGIRGRGFFRAVIFLPNVVATIALTTLWAYIYNPRFGLLNSLFDLVGLETLADIKWTAPGTIFWAMLVAFIWVFVGFYLVLLMAGADKIPVEFYEAAKLDGASQLQMFVKITIPLLWDVITIAIIMWSIAAIKIFEFPFAFTSLEPVPETYTSAVYLYVMGFGQRTPIYRLGYASAIGVFMLLAVIFIVLVLGRIMRREVVQY
ncbi:MAG: ABC transporter permease subunit [Ardenticatenales bacterium]|nr:ABC transporter permease subunit [Ardenticatenales bacterium]